MAVNTEKPVVKPELPHLFLGSSPHIAIPIDTAKIMGCVLIALTPSAIYGIYIYGIPALLTIIVSVAAAVFGEFIFRKITKQTVRSRDLSAVVTGLLLALIVPPGIGMEMGSGLWMAALGAFFAVIVAKEFFGGLGANVFNPALAGRAFLLMSFPAVMTTWPDPKLIDFSLKAADTVSSATPMALIKSGGDLQSLGSNYSEIIKTLFFGAHSGSIGESSVLMILIGFIFLLVTKLIDWRTPVFMLATVAGLSFLFGRDPLIAVMGGGVLFGAVFMATDYVTSPFSGIGKIIFGCGAGILIVLIRQWGAYPEGAAYSILIMNAVTPFLNRILPQKYGYVKAVKAKPVKEALK